MARMTSLVSGPRRAFHPMTRRSVFWVILVLSVLGGPAGWLRAEGGWRPVEWRGEKAWAATGAGWTAIVSEGRARLVSLTPPGGGDNLLFAELKNEFSWGGHRFWLGPQGSWAVVWPPPTDWETSPAAKVVPEGAVLRVWHPHTDKNYPEVSRSYEWREGVLHCTVSWRDARFQGIHVIQIPPKAVVRVRRKVDESMPLGYVLLPIYRRDGLLTNREVSPAVATVEGDLITLRHAKVTEKIGVPPQDIEADIGAYRLTLRRGKMSGMSENEPDRGMLTQVFLGSRESVFTEIEQLTPLGGEGTAVSEVLLEPAVLPGRGRPAPVQR